MSQPIGGVYSLGGSIESHLIPLPSLCDGKGSSFPGLVPSDDVVDSDSVMGIKPGDSSVVIGYQVGEFTCTWSAEQFVARSHIYPGFTGKVTSLTHFLLEPGCEDYAFLDQAVADFKQGLDSIFTDSLKTPQCQADSSPIVCAVLALDSWNYCSGEQAWQPDNFFSMFAMHGFID